MSTKTETAKESKENKETKGKTLSIKDISLGRSELHNIDPRVIQVFPGFNVRKDMGDIKGLAASIRENGVQEPLQVFIKDNTVYVDRGHRRLEAVKMLIAEGLDIKSIPCRIEPKGVSEEERIVGLITSNDGMPLSVLEKAVVYDRLAKFGWDDCAIAKRFGISQSSVSNARLLVDLPKPVEKAIINEQIAPTYVMELRRELSQEAKKKTKDNEEVDVEAIRSKLTDKVAKAVEKAKSIGKNKATKKISNEGTTKKKSRKNEKQSLIDLLKSAVKAIQGSDDVKPADVVEELEAMIAQLAGGATTVKAS